MKLEEIKDLSVEELQKRINEEQKSIIDLKFALAFKQLTNTSKIGESKKNIARLKTVLRQKELAKKS